MDQVTLAGLGTEESMQMKRLIAEKIMGGHDCWRLGLGRCDGTRQIQCGACGGIGHGNCYGNGSGPVDLVTCCETLPDFTDSWEGAGLVVERMREQGWTVSVYDTAHRTGFVCLMERFDDGTQTDCVEEHATSFQLAVCRAALRASGVEVGWMSVERVSLGENYWTHDGTCTTHVDVPAEHVHYGQHITLGLDVLHDGERAGGWVPAEILAAYERWRNDRVPS